MKKNFVLVLGLSTLLFSACSNDDVLSNATDTEFKVSSAILPTTKTPQLDNKGAGAFSTGDVNTLFFYTSTNEHVTTFNYTYGTAYKWSDVALPNEITSWKISACYPPVQTSNPESFNWDITKQDYDDLLVATPTNVKSNQSATVDLMFAHALHKLEINLTADKNNVTDEELNKASISCKNIKPVAVINLLKGTSINAQGNLTQLHSTGKSANFIIPSQAVGNICVYVKIGSSEKTIQLSAHQSGSLLTGQSLSLKIKVSKHDEPSKPDYSFEIEDTTISGWGNQGQIEDSIII